MSSDKLIATLADLAANRRLGLEASTALDPFRGEEFSLRFVFDAAERTFGNRLNSAYEEGKTVTCKLKDIEVTVLLLPKENDRVDALKPGDDLEVKVTPLDFDSLYQRAVLGQVLEQSPEIETQKEEASPEAEEETTEEPEKQAPAAEPLPQEEPTAAPEAPAKIPQDAPEPAPAKPEEPEKFTIMSSPSPKKKRTAPRKSTRRKLAPKKDSGRKPSSSRFGKAKQGKLFRIKELVVKKIKKLRRAPCPNGHGPLTHYHKGKRYCKVCGWPGHKSAMSDASTSDSGQDAGNEIDGCWKFGCILVVLSFVLVVFLTVLAS